MVSGLYFRRHCLVHNVLNCAQFWIILLLDSFIINFQGFIVVLIVCYTNRAVLECMKTWALQRWEERKLRFHIMKAHKSIRSEITSFRRQSQKHRMRFKRSIQERNCNSSCVEQQGLSQLSRINSTTSSASKNNNSSSNNDGVAARTTLPWMAHVRGEMMPRFIKILSEKVLSRKNSRSRLFYLSYKDMGGSEKAEDDDMLRYSKATFPHPPVGAEAYSSGSTTVAKSSTFLGRGGLTRLSTVRWWTSCAFYKEISFVVNSLLLIIWVNKKRFNYFWRMEKHVFLFFICFYNEILFDFCVSR